MKKTFLLFISFCVSILTQAATTITVGNLNYLIKDEVSVYVTSKPHSHYEDAIISIPETVEYEGKTYTVTGIGNGAFLGCSALESLSIPSSVTEIQSQAFSGCSSLASISLPENITSIESSTFFQCTCLKSIIIPSNVTNIGNKAFYGCKNLETISFNQGLVSIGESAFDMCSAISSIDIPESVTSIGSGAFHQCTALTSASLPSTLVEIGGNAFNNCKNMLTLYCKASVPPTLLGYSVFGMIQVSNGKLYVPAASIDTYKTTNQWKDWGAVLELDEETSISSIEVTDHKCPTRKVLRGNRVVILKEGNCYSVNGVKHNK